MTETPRLQLNGYAFETLFQPDGLNRLDQDFLVFVQQNDAQLYETLKVYRDTSHTLPALELSEFLIALARHLEAFLAHFFNIEEALAISSAQTTSYNPIAVFKKYFVLKRAKKEVNKAEGLPAFAELTAWLQTALASAPVQSKDPELAIALLGQHYLSDPEKFAAEIEKLVQWCVQALRTPDGKLYVKDFTAFQIPERIDHAALVPTITSDDKFCRKTAEPATLRERDGFKLTDPRMTAKQVQNEVNYCIYCHDHEGDFCSKGFPVKKGEPAQGFKKNPLDITLTGCPLEEKISEMQLLKRDGHTLASLAMVMVDNPMCPATGHRICNDCMKACIYQKQDPVNIPQIETRVLTDVLHLPWGVEIYDLLTRWNPLRQTQYVMKPYNGLKVLIAGMGPAGFTLAHHLLLEGFAVVGFDGLKIEPLPQDLINQPIYRYQDLQESLDERLMAGFGGVAEYGITVRWDKNFLKLIYLSLMRKPCFQVFGGVRFGGTITVEDAFSMGFDHFVLAVGAGLPKALPIPNSLAPGMRQANDFLMALQLGNAAKASSLTCLQIRLPAVVIGGGLTGVDTATEAQAYYLSQIEKIAYRYQTLVGEYGEDPIQSQLDAPSREILAEFLRHAHAVKQERERAAIEKRAPNFIQLIREWGGVTIAYRRSMQESPAYINNHEELQKALEEGIYYLEGMEPTAVDLNEFGHSEALICKKRIRNQDNEWITSNESVRLPARSILVATGTSPNTAYEFEHRGTFNRLNLQYQHYEDRHGKLEIAHGVEHCKDPQFGAFTSYHQHDKRVSLIGDTHPVFHGNVVKAIASGMRTYPKIVAILQKQMKQDVSMHDYHEFAQRMTHLFSTRITHIERKNQRTVELTIQAPLAVKHFQPGQFFRLQNFETLAPHINHTLIQMEPISLVGAECNRQEESITFIVRENSASAKLCSILKKHEPVSLMGPTGVRSRIPDEHETVLIIGDEKSFAFARSYGSELRRAGNRVIYAGQFNNSEEVYCRSQLEAASDVILYQVNNGTPVEIKRHTDVSVKGNDIITSLLHYHEGKLGQTPVISLHDVDRIFVVGTPDLLRAFQSRRKTVLKPYLLKDPKVFGSVYGNMQCMLKGVCAQCLQWQIDPETGARTKAVFACSWQDQPLEIIDIDHIDARAAQNHLLDQINLLWVDHLFDRYPVAKI